MGHVGREICVQIHEFAVPPDVGRGNRHGVKPETSKKPCQSHRDKVQLLVHHKLDGVLAEFLRVGFPSELHRTVGMVDCTYNHAFCAGHQALRTHHNRCLFETLDIGDADQTCAKV